MTDMGDSHRFEAPLLRTFLWGELMVDRDGWRPEMVSLLRLRVGEMKAPGHMWQALACSFHLRGMFERLARSAQYV